MYSRYTGMWNRIVVETMSKNNDQAWMTKYGPRRVRQEQPTLGEAIAAAQGMSDTLDEQAEIAAALMGLPQDQVRAELLKLAPPRKDTVKSILVTGSASAPRMVVVERKPSRRLTSTMRATSVPVATASR
jgi:hypothetical protein